MRAIAILVLVLAALGGVTATSVHAQDPDTLRVPYAYGTIDSALAAASAGDLVLVSNKNSGDPEVAYSETLTVKSGVQVVAKSGQTPIIDGGTLRATAVSFESGASSSTILQGFTIRGGTDTVVVVCGSGTIRDCTIGDIGRSTPVPGDIGIHCESGGSVKHCTISMTKNIDAGIRAVGSAFIDSCTVETNSSNGPDVGFDLEYSDGTPELRHSSVTGPGAGLFYGVFARGTVTVADCEVDLTDNGSGGAGMAFDDGGPTMTDCTVNVAAGTGVMQAYFQNSTDLSMDNCQIDVTD